MVDLFTKFEVNRDVRWSALLRLLGASLVAHLIVVASVVYVPGLRDAFNLASLIGDTSFVDKDYKTTTIGDDVQIVDISGGKFPLPGWILCP